MRSKFFILLFAGLLTMFVASISDVIGRKICFLLSLAAILSGNIIGIIFNDFYTLTFAMSLTMLGAFFLQLISGLDSFFSVLFVFLNECIGGKMRVVSASVTFIFFGLGEVAINLVSVFMNYFKYYFVLQSVTIGLAGVLLFFFRESPFYTYKKRTLGDLYTIARYIISKNFETKNERQRALLEVQKLMGIDSLLVDEAYQAGVDKPNSKAYLEDHPELTYLTLPNSSEKYTLSDSNDSLSNNLDAHEKKYEIPAQNLLNQALQLKPNKAETAQKKANRSELNFKDIFRKQHLMTLVGVSVVMGGLYAEYGICMFINQKIGIDNIYLNGSLLGIVEVIGYILIFLFANKLGRKQINIYSNLYILVASLALVIMDSFHNELYHGVKKALWFQITETGNSRLKCDRRHQSVHQARHLLPVRNHFQLRDRTVSDSHPRARPRNCGFGGARHVVSGLVPDLFHRPAAPAPAGDCAGDELSGSPFFGIFEGNQRSVDL